jgi:hypothetical protein
MEGTRKYPSLSLKEDTKATAGDMAKLKSNIGCFFSGQMHQPPNCDASLKLTTRRVRISRETELTLGPVAVKNLPESRCALQITRARVLYLWWYTSLNAAAEPGVQDVACFCPQKNHPSEVRHQQSLLHEFLMSKYVGRS